MDEKNSRRGRRPITKEEEGTLRIAIEHLRAPTPPRDNYQRRIEASVARFGVMHPLLVSPTESGCFHVLDGARRLQAAKNCGISGLLCRPINDRERELTAQIFAEEGNMFTQAEALSALIACCSLTQEEAALRLGLSQGAVANKLRLLKLTEEDRSAILSNGLTERHARALLALQPAHRGEAIAKIASSNLTVAAAETMIEEMRTSRAHPCRAALRDIGIFYNSIDRALSILHNANIPATLSREESEDGVTVTIHVSRGTKPSPCERFT